MSEYLPRLIEFNIAEQSEVMGCIVVEGPKWCGKSTTAKRFAKTVVELQRDKVYQKYSLFAANGDDEYLLEGEKPLMFDEWQKLPSLWDTIRAEVDTIKEKGQFILTGSAKPIEDKGRHSGAGRMVKIVMRPMSLWESQESTGQISLGALFNGETKIKGDAQLDISRIAFITCRGGWPAAILMDDKNALLASRNYYKLLVEVDITDVDDIKRNPERAKKILHAYARQVSSLAANRTILKDVAEVCTDGKTLISYLNAFKKLFVIEDVLAWSPKLRSKTTIQTTPKRQFVDPSVAAQALEVCPEDLLDDVHTFGLLFESLCTRDLRIYAAKLGGTIYHYHDEKGLEADIIIHLDNGDWAAVEVKLGGHQIDEAAKNLLKLKEKIDSERMREPKFLMVLTGLDYAYRRPNDGIFVVPIGCLRD
ncbi:MAG: DUF4143 domain-containing protein [Christensenellaceae bacterium]|jgi:predicted AAA+ superfamily ATPase|nr:DUF4143 domain-containing protein [Christensenellaceae bacterium]